MSNKQAAALYALFAALVLVLGVFGIDTSSIETQIDQLTLPVATEIVTQEIIETLPPTPIATYEPKCRVVIGQNPYGDVWEGTGYGAVLYREPAVSSARLALVPVGTTIYPTAIIGETDLFAAITYSGIFGYIQITGNVPVLDYPACADLLPPPTPEATAIPGPTPLPAVCQIKNIAGYSINLRYGDSTLSGVAGQMKPNDVAEVVSWGTSGRNGWLRINIVYGDTNIGTVSVAGWLGALEYGASCEEAGL